MAVNMLGSLRPKKERQVYAERSPFSSPYSTRERRLQNVDEEQMTDPEPEPEEDSDEIEDEDEDEDVQETSPLLPIFSASHLGMASGFVETKREGKEN